MLDNHGLNVEASINRFSCQSLPALSMAWRNCKLLSTKDVSRRNTQSRGDLWHRALQLHCLKINKGNSTSILVFQSFLVVLGQGRVLSCTGRIPVCG